MVFGRVATLWHDVVAGPVYLREQAGPASCCVSARAG